MSNTARQEVLDAIKRIQDMGKREILIGDVYIQVPMNIDWDLTMETLKLMQQEGVLTIGDDNVVTLNEQEEGKG